MAVGVDASRARRPTPATGQNARWRGGPRGHHRVDQDVGDARRRAPAARGSGNAPRRSRSRPGSARRRGRGSRSSRSRGRGAPRASSRSGRAGRRPVRRARSTAAQLAHERGEAAVEGDLVRHDRPPGAGRGDQAVDVGHASRPGGFSSSSGMPRSRTRQPTAADALDGHDHHHGVGPLGVEHRRGVGEGAREAEARGGTLGARRRRGRSRPASTRSGRSAALAGLRRPVRDPRRARRSRSGRASWRSLSRGSAVLDRRGRPSRPPRSPSPSRASASRGPSAGRRGRSTSASRCRCRPRTCRRSSAPRGSRARAAGSRRCRSSPAAGSARPSAAAPRRGCGWPSAWPGST